MPHSIAIANEQGCLALDESRIRAAVSDVLNEADLREAEISLAFVDNARIHELNRTFLQHDFPTDVISFVLERDENRLEGEVVVSAEMARATAPRWNWPPEHELLLYVVHGVLHLVGYDDTTDAAAAKMRLAERVALNRLGIDVPPYDSRPMRGASVASDLNLERRAD